MSKRTIEEIGHDIRTQDNRATADPMFCVQIQVASIGYDTRYIDSLTCWVNMESGDNEVRFNAPGENEEDFDEWEEFGYVLRWETVATTFTKKGAEAYVEAQKHNLSTMAHKTFSFPDGIRIYVDSYWRCDEMITVRQHLMNSSGEKEAS